jgi:hypothetical protein
MPEAGDGNTGGWHKLELELELRHSGLRRKAEKPRGDHYWPGSTELAWTPEQGLAPRSQRQSSPAFLLLIPHITSSSGYQYDFRAGTLLDICGRNLTGRWSCAVEADNCRTRCPPRIICCEPSGLHLVSVAGPETPKQAEPQTATRTRSTAGCRASQSHP